MILLICSKNITSGTFCNFKLKVTTIVTAIKSTTLKPDGKVKHLQSEKQGADTYTQEPSETSEHLCVFMVEKQKRMDKVNHLPLP